MAADLSFPLMSGRAAPAAEEVDENFDFSFAPSTAEVVEEENPYELNMNSGKAAEEGFFDEPAPEPRRSPRERGMDMDLDPYENSRAKKQRPAPSGDQPAATISGRVGASKFQELNFVTYGGEISYYVIYSFFVFQILLITLKYFGEQTRV